MSLRVWLPLTKDLRNQGLDDISSLQLVSGNSFVAGGKIGEKAFNITKQQRILSYPSCMTGKKQMSYAFWVKVNTVWTTQWLDGIAWYSTDETSASYSRQEFYNNCTKVGTWFKGSPNGLSGYDFNPEEWTHIAATFNYNTGEVKFYLNGELKGTTNGLSTSDYCRGDFYIGDSGLDILENDVRIYDHCLSPMEIKEISQGLILHYPLNRNGWGQENLITGYDTSFLSYSDGAVTLFNNQMNGGIQEIVSNIGGAIKCLHLHNNGGNGRQYGVFGATSGKSYTISCDYYSTSSQAYPFRGELNGGNYSWVGSNATAYTTPNKWVRLSFSYLNLTSDATIFYFMQCSQNTDCYIKNLKLEEGSIATPWCPNSANTLATTMGLNDNVEYDVSGYCNNGTRTGTFSWTSDTPKYQISTYFADGSISYITASVFMPTDKITTSIWFKGDGSTSGANSYHIPFCLGSGTAEFSIDNAKLYRQGYYINGTRYCDTISGAIVNDGQWHMMTATYDGATLCRYLDGQLINSKSISGTLNGGMLTLLIGKYYQGGYNNKKVKQSDVRIYATALSADDVKSLYQNSAYIDNQSNIYGAVYEEV